MTFSPGLMPSTEAVDAATDFSTPHDELRIRMKFRVRDKTHEVGYRQAFALGHDLLKKRNFRSAAAIFEELIRAPDREPQADIFLAVSKAGLSQYSIAFAVLKTAPHL